MATYYAVRSVVRDTKVDDQYGGPSTTMVEALGRAYLEVAKCLIDRGADVNKANNDGETPPDMALSGNHAQKAALLREAGAHEPRYKNGH